MQTTPSHATQLICPIVLMLARMNPRIAQQAAKTAVHAPWVDMAFKEIERARILDPETKIQSAQQLECGFWCPSKLTNAEYDTGKLAGKTTKHHSTSIINAIDRRMATLKGPDHIV